MPQTNKLVKAIIVAAGSSKRLNPAAPKQLFKIRQKPILAYTLDVFEQTDIIDSIILVVHRHFKQQCQDLIEKYRYRKIEQIVMGGATRRQSVFNALRKAKDCTCVIVHDGVRPFVSARDILATVKAAQRYQAATCAIEATDTIAKMDQGFIDCILYRKRLCRIQTPQAFSFDLLFRAHQLAKKKRIVDPTDDAQLVLELKHKVKVVPGSYQNIKITTPFDLSLAKTILSGKNK